ncbi:unnamed protein product [Bursaphelenchus okinawaensis]|uniref:Uncharacterized protein n=1 Tax=Bursaphelenchus okinawaensis TaxID=465554 RepID=A0A811KIY1_9BILA|nr:unnamed protein product [Bursaphelenchus okinawaensis]CAG9105605.1 unnamed protein product [Bursaphelenchus okinawaensis]
MGIEDDDCMVKMCKWQIHVHKAAFVLGFVYIVLGFFVGVSVLQTQDYIALIDCLLYVGSGGLLLHGNTQGKPKFYWPLMIFNGMHVFVSFVYFLYVFAVLIGVAAPSQPFDEIGDIGALIGYSTGERVGIAAGELIMCLMLSWFGYVVYRGYKYLVNGGLPF